MISTSDLIHFGPVSRSEDGIPVGNVRMGSLVWTTSSQLNRIDVYASNCQTNSFVEIHDDYCGGYASLTLHLRAVHFRNRTFGKYLSVYVGVLAIDGAVQSPVHES